jgi:ferric-dicitrate binding protein FerR (iron transport regulator)
MSGKGKDLDQLLDQTLDEIRGAQLDPATEKAAADRVWNRVSQEIETLSEQASGPQQIRDCEDFQALIPAYLRGGLTEAKALLLEDHVGECLPCRKALKRARTAHRRSEAPAAGATERSWANKLAWRVAAAAVIFIALVGLSVKTDLFAIEAGGLIEIEAVEGEVFTVTDEGTAPLTPGERVSFEDVNGVRTGKGASAMVRLDDGSLVEMNERTELAIKQRRKLWERGSGDGVVDLARGNIIIEASDQGSGNLFVETNDCQVAVTGTVFAVNNGVKGSRVSVIEGEVEVAYAGQEDVLAPGQQTTTQPGLAMIPIEEEIAWSRNLEQHLALLHEFARVALEIDRQLERPELRFSTALLDRSPEGTVIYIAIPNVSAMVSEAYDLLQQKINENDLLQQWWSESVAGTEVESELQRTMEKIRAYGEQIGEEVVITVQLGDNGDPEELLILTQLNDPQAFRELIDAELAGLVEYGEGAPGICVIETDGTQCATGDDLFILIRESYLAVAPDIDAIRTFAGSMQQVGGSGFGGSAFHSRLADSYADGVHWLFAMDLESLLQYGPDESDRVALERLGLLDMQHAIVERKELGDSAENRAVLTFDQPRRGLAAWLAEPAPMGALEFISSEAYFAGGFVMKEPASVVDELFEFVGAEEANFEQSLAEFESEHAIDIREDVAAALGGEFAFALEPPVLPKPSWKLVMEVYDPARLQATIEWAAGRINELLGQEGRQGLRTAQSESGGRIFYEIESLDTGISAHYMFVDGYFVASASRALLERSLQFRSAGATLTRNSRFTALLPQNAEINFSAVMYQNMGPVLGPLAKMGEGTAANISPEAEELLASLGSMTAPSLTLAYGEPNRIVFVNTSEGGILASSLGRFLSLDSLLSVQQLLGQAVEEEHRSRQVDVNEG